VVINAENGETIVEVTEPTGPINHMEVFSSVESGRLSILLGGPREKLSLWEPPQMLWQLQGTEGHPWQHVSVAVDTSSPKIVASARDGAVGTL
jgi:hypothetical protein